MVLYKTHFTPCVNSDIYDISTAINKISKYATLNYHMKNSVTNVAKRKTKLCASILLKLRLPIDTASCLQKNGIVVKNLPFGI
jgi:hypothetical protein